MTDDRDWDDDVEDLDDAEMGAPAVARGRRDDDGELWEVRYPRPGGHTPPPGLSRRQRRRWLRDTRREETAERNATVRQWKRDRPESARNGLGVLLVAVGLVFAGWVWWPREAAEPAPAPVTPSVAPYVVPAPPRADPTRAGAAPTTGTSTPAGELAGGDDAPPTAPAALDGTDGVLAHDFLLAYNTYSPAYPDPVGTWVGGWAAMAAPALVEAAPADAPRLWDFTVQQAVSVSTAAVTDVTPVTDTPGDGVRGWEVTVVRTLFPVGGDATSPTRQQTARIRVTVTGGDPPAGQPATAPLVTGVQVLSTGEPGQ